MQQAFELISPSLPASGRDQNIALVDIGAHVTHFYVLRNNQFLFSRDQAFGGNQLTHDVQRAFNLTPDEAESAKKSQGLPENYDTDVLQPFMETLALEVTRALQFFFTSTSYNQVDQIVLAGGCALLPGHRRARRQAGRRHHGHRQPVRQHGDFRSHPAAAARAGRAAADDRLRPRAAELRMIRINLLPHREQKRQARQRQFVSLSIGLAVMGLALVALGWVILGAQIESQERPQRPAQDRDREARRADQGDRQAARADAGAARPEAGRRDAAGQPDRSRPRARPDGAPAPGRHLPASR